MATPLRAFLMRRPMGGEWDVAVYQTLEDVLRAWEAGREDAGLAVLHIGFDRKPARVYEEAAALHPGRLVLTEGARGALPATFATSSRPIALVDEAPIFLALRGWGYEAEDTAPVEPEPKRRFSDWVVALADVDADMAERVAVLGVTCEVSYKARELELPAEVRRALGAFRFELVMHGDRANPCEIARAAPPWLTTMPLDQLPLTVRLANVFRQSGLLTVADLAATKLNHLMKQKNFGRTSAHHLVGILNTAIATGPAPPVVEAERHTGGTLLASVHTSLASLSERDGAIVRARMGLNCQPLTLVELGEVYGVTRERIRQIEERSIERLARAEVWDDVFTAKLQSLLAGRDHPLPLIGVEALDPWFAELGRQRNVARYLLRNLTTGGAALVEVDGLEYLSLMGQADWDAAIVKARAMLASVAAEGWTRAECRSHCDIVLPPEAREFATLLWDDASRLCHFSDETDMGVLIAYGRGAEQSVERVLHLSDVPLHYSEIASRLAKEGKTVDERRVHNAAAAVGHLLGPGVYGLLKHIAVSRETMEAWAAEAADIVEAGPTGRQWHASELADEISVRLDAPDIGKYLLDVALKQQGVLASLGRMIWTAADGSTDNARVEVRQATIAILEAAGRPLSATELRQRLIAVRGLNIAMQVQVVDPIIKIDSRTFGLNDRDLDLKRDDQFAELGRLAAILAKEAGPMTIDRCAALLGTLIPPRALSCLAAADPRLRVLPGGLVTVPSASMNGATDRRKVAEETGTPEPHSVYKYYSS